MKTYAGLHQVKNIDGSHVDELIIGKNYCILSPTQIDDLVTCQSIQDGIALLTSSAEHSSLEYCISISNQLSESEMVQIEKLMSSIPTKEDLPLLNKALLSGVLKATLNGYQLN